MNDLILLAIGEIKTPTIGSSIKRIFELQRDLDFLPMNLFTKACRRIKVLIEELPSTGIRNAEDLDERFRILAEILKTRYEALSNRYYDLNERSLTIHILLKYIEDEDTPTRPLIGYLLEIYAKQYGTEFNKLKQKLEKLILEKQYDTQSLNLIKALALRISRIGLTQCIECCGGCYLFRGCSLGRPYISRFLLNRRLVFTLMTYLLYGKALV